MTADDRGPQAASAEPLPRENDPAGVDASGIDPAELARALEVLRHAEALDPSHPDALQLRRATARLFKAVKKQRRLNRRAAIQAADEAVVAATATGSPRRIDDETAGLPLVSTARGASAGSLQRARPCYVCKEPYSQVDAFYHQLCPDCAAMHHEKREARTDLTGRRALLTGGRAKIGMYIALRLLRDGASTTITTRFPRDAVRRFRAMPDADEWIDRLTVVGLDLRDPAQVVALADEVASAGPLDVLINNAAQTVRRSAGSYAPLVAAEEADLPDGPLPHLITFEHASDAHPAALVGSVGNGAVGHDESGQLVGRAQRLTAEALQAGSSSLTRLAQGDAIDAGGLVPDTARTNSWVATVDQVDALEMLEVQLCNATAPFILVSRLRRAMAASPARRTYVVNVSAMEGVFSRGYKGPGHPHTNMAKAAVNMLTRTSATELADDGILMTSVDTGWITDERPHPTKVRLAEEGFHAPLDLVDGAARVYDPIVRGEAGEDLYGVFLKDYKPSGW
ncbi:SDR family oxidoreductase [Actinotalea sp. C106]|uniref:SDR family oxidoreductase n=1 Tax=Actinotalea sp. C106 TaxID=2908644 RepID=UPI002027FEE2|nr:SDR family oxidoreductase [Actinotalea sp. C106]